MQSLYRHARLSHTAAKTSGSSKTHAPVIGSRSDPHLYFLYKCLAKLVCQTPVMKAADSNCSSQPHVPSPASTLSHCLIFPPRIKKIWRVLANLVSLWSPFHNSTASGRIVPELPCARQMGIGCLHCSYLSIPFPCSLTIIVWLILSKQTNTFN